MSAVKKNGDERGDEGDEGKMSDGDEGGSEGNEGGLRDDKER